MTNTGPVLSETSTCWFATSVPKAFAFSAHINTLRCSNFDLALNAGIIACVPFVSTSLIIRLGVHIDEYTFLVRMKLDFMERSKMKTRTVLTDVDT